MSKYTKLEDCGSEFGVKAGNLARAMALGLAVPKGVVIPAGVSLTKKDIEEISSHMQFPVMVRSSTSVEDTDVSSLAGVFRSEKVETVEDVERAIESVRLWTKSSKVKALLRSLSIDPAGVQTHVIIQEYVEAQSGGVLFTYPEKREFEVEIGGSSTAVTDGTGQTKTHTLPMDREVDTAFADLQKLAQIVSEAYGDRGQDIEWLRSVDGELYVVQIRPQVTTTETLSDPVQHELDRLEQHVPLNSDYSTLLLPDLHTPTPLTVSLLEKIYASNGPYGQHLKDMGFAVGDQDMSYVVSIFGRPHFDIRRCNETALKDAVQKLHVEQGIVRYKRTLSDRLRSMLHPVATLRQQFTASRQLYRLKKRRASPLPSPPNKKWSPQELVDFVLQELCSDIFRTADNIELVRGLLQKRIPNTDDFVAATEDTTLPSWVRSESAETWHISDDENEISAPPLKGPEAIQRIRQAYTKTEDKQNARVDVASKTVSSWDTTISQNLLTLLDELQERRAQLHDRYVQAIRALHLQLHATYGDDIWYASLDDVLNDNVPKKAVLKQRAAAWKLLLSQPLQPLATVRSWSELVAPQPKEGDGAQATVLSPGSFEGLAVTEVPKTKKGSHVLLATSLSQNVIFNRDQLVGVVTERGGRLSHVAILARELGLPIVQVDSIQPYVGKKIRVSGETVQKNS